MKFVRIIKMGKLKRKRVDLMRRRELKNMEWGLLVVAIILDRRRDKWDYSQHVENVR